METLAERIMSTIELITKENKSGGALTDLPCPFCGLPRSLRSDYIRCQPCGVNWTLGTDLTRNPHAKPAPTESMILTQARLTDAHSRYTDPK